MSDVTDLNQVHDLYDRLLKFPVIDRSEVERFAQTYFGGMLGGAGSGERGAGATQRVTTRAKRPERAARHPAEA